MNFRFLFVCLFQLHHCVHHVCIIFFLSMKIGSHWFCIQEQKTKRKNPILITPYILINFEPEKNINPDTLVMIFCFFHCINLIYLLIIDSCINFFFVLLSFLLYNQIKDQITYYYYYFDFDSIFYIVSVFVMIKIIIIINESNRIESNRK